MKFVVLINIYLYIWEDLNRFFDKEWRWGKGEERKRNSSFNILLLLLIE